MTKLHIQGLNHVMITVSDLPASEHFYGEILELPRIPRPLFSFPGAWFALGGQELHLVGGRPVQPAPRGHHHFALLVADAGDARRTLEEKGYTQMRGPAPRPDGAMQLFVTDPDGYVLELMSPPPALKE